jgi:hypothetical protein
MSAALARAVPRTTQPPRTTAIEKALYLEHHVNHFLFNLK